MPEPKLKPFGAAWLSDGKIAIVDVGIHRIDLRRQVPKCLYSTRRCVDRDPTQSEVLEFFLDNETLFWFISVCLAECS